jgi:hypothetical protein
VPSSITNLTRIYDGQLEIQFNGLYSSDPAVVTFLTGKQWHGDWQSSQTVPVTGLVPGVAPDSLVVLTWTPITYTGGTGGYQVFYATTSGGPYTLSGMTADKTASGCTVTSLRPTTTYYFIVRSVTNADADNQNTVVSDPSAEVSATTTAKQPPRVRRHLRHAP